MYETLEHWKEYQKKTKLEKLELELKQMLKENSIKELKQIIVETDFGHVEIMSEGPNGYNSFKTSQGENALQYALNREEYKSGEYELVIK